MAWLFNRSRAKANDDGNGSFSGHQSSKYKARNGGQVVKSVTEICNPLYELRDDDKQRQFDVDKL